MAFDLVSSEYGWTDEEIGEVTVARLRQIVVAIRTRQFLASREENNRFSWLARSLGTLIAGGYMMEKGKENPGIKIAQKLAMDDIESALLESPPPPKPKQNKPGSYEMFMGAFGNGMRRD